MSLAEAKPLFEDGPEQDEFDEFASYRSLSRPAIASLILAIFSAAAFLFPGMLILPVAGMVLGLIAIRSIKKYPEEYSGLGIARAGVIACTFAAVAAASMHTIEYVTEVPEGYERVSFYELQPDDDHPELPVPPNALELDGKRVFIKGFVYPDGQQNNIQQFVLVPDRGTCCFGGQPKLTDMIEVSIVSDDRVKYSLQMRKLAGTLHVDTRLKPVSGLGGVYYRLEADYVK